MKIEQADRIIVDTILKPNRRYDDIDGAPLKIGDKVQVLGNPLKDETFNDEYVNQEGVVSFFEYDCGCGQAFPESPMIGINFGDGQMAEFWLEELLLI